MNSISNSIGLTSLPRELLITIGRNLSVREAPKLGLVCKLFRDLSPHMQLRTAEQARRMLQRVVKEGDLPTVERWARAIELAWEPKLRMTPQTPGPSLKMLEARFSNYLTISHGYRCIEEAQIAAKSYPRARFQLDFSEWKPQKNEQAAEELNRLFSLIPTIRSIIFDYVRLPDSVLQRIKWPRSLDEFSCVNIANSGAILANLPISVKRLELPQCHLKDSDFACISRLTQLEELSLEGADGPIEGISFASLPATLRTLDCTSCVALDDDELIHLSHLTQLQKLDLSAIPIGGRGLVHLPTSLRSLYLVDCCLMEEALEHLPRFTQLTDLDVSQNDAIEGKV